MRIYLACTVRGNRSGILAARLAASRLTALGHEILTGHLLEDDVERSESALTEAEVYERDIRWLDSCDMLVAEASGSSYGVGFEVGYITGRAPRSGQRVCLLYDASRRNEVSRLVSGCAGPACSTLPYTSLDEVAAFVDREFGQVTSLRAPNL